MSASFINDQDGTQETERETHREACHYTRYNASVSSLAFLRNGDDVRLSSGILWGFRGGRGRIGVNGAYVCPEIDVLSGKVSTRWFEKSICHRSTWKAGAVWRAYGIAE